MLRKNLLAGVAIAALAFGGSALAQSQQSGQQGQQQSQGQQAQSGQQQNQTQQQEQKEGAKLYVGSTVIVEAQKQLNKEGFDVGEVNGKLSDSMKSALKNFQKQNNMAATGELTIDTLQTLGIDFMTISQQDQGKIDGQPAELKVGPTIVSQIQKQLNERGFDVGEVNGKWNDKTAKAAQAFQREQGMTATKNLNVGLIQALGVDLAGGGAGKTEMPASEDAQATTLYIAPDLLKQVKMQLNKQGFDAGSVNAEWNDEARTALKNFLKAQGVSETEQLTVSALSALGIDWRSGGQDTGGATVKVTQ